jgi:hypothetical protein
VIERTRRFNVLLSEDELRMLQHVADSYGLSASDYFRLKLREDYETTQIPPPIAPAKKPKKK